MSADPNKKSARTFQCRDVLWETFEQMARELECSIDYLINESMKQYARQRSYSPGAPPRGATRTDGSPGSVGQNALPMGQGGAPPPTATPAPPPMGPPQSSFAPAPPPPPPAYGGPPPGGPPAPPP
ncbi:MAG TPA: hypothetical protein VLS89_21170, partial [Candidatus Nanopelagicales bacterium]|nr:hypothetical protein [Candidatus Nanopelagicales bacterium]